MLPAHTHDVFWISGMRPTWGYARQGEDAWFDGSGEAQNPYPEDTLANLEWLAGNLTAGANSGDLDDPDGIRAYLDDIEGWLRMHRARLKRGLPSAQDTATAIGLALGEWPGNCYGVAELALKSGILDSHQAEHGPLILTYGAYYGHIDSTSHFGGRPFSRHGWLESPAGHVVDPTRFVFTASHPEIWAGSGADYDLSHARVRERLNPRPPEPDGGRSVRLPLNDPDSLSVFDRLLGSGSEVRRTGSIEIRRLSWIANLSLERLGCDAPMVFRTIEQAGWPGIVPSDCRRWVVGVAGLENGRLTQAPST